MTRSASFSQKKFKERHNGLMIHEFSVQGSSEELFSKIKTRFESEGRNHSLGKYFSHVHFNDQTKMISASGQGFSAEIHCQDQKISVDMKLNWLLRPLESKISGKIQEFLSQMA